MNLFDFHLALPITDPTWVFFLVLRSEERRVGKEC